MQSILTSRHPPRTYTINHDDELIEVERDDATTEAAPVSHTVRGAVYLCPWLASAASSWAIAGAD